MPSLLLALFASTPHPLPSLTQHTERVNVNSAAVQAQFVSGLGSISADGRYVAFHSAASNLVQGDTNSTWDIFVHDRRIGQTTRVSVDSGGLQGDSFSHVAKISADGRYVAFNSNAANLVLGDTNSEVDIFVHDRQTGQTTRVNVDSSGQQTNRGTLSFVNHISADGRFVTFSSNASNLVTGDTNAFQDAFVHDRLTGQTTRVNVDSSGLQANWGYSYAGNISDDGRFVVFSSEASNLVPGDTNSVGDAFVHDRLTGQTARVSVDSRGQQAGGGAGEATISANGRYVAFTSSSSDLVPSDTNGLLDIFIHDRQTSSTTLVSVDSGGLQSNGFSAFPSISMDGRFVTFSSDATNLVSGDTNGERDIFLHDMLTGQTTRVSMDSFGVQSNSYSQYSEISDDGRCVTFDSDASNLVLGDTNGMIDVFVHDRQLIAPALSASGSCPGPMTLHLDAVSPEGNVAFAIGGSGSFTIPSGPCAGSTLDLASPRLGPVIRASWHGTITHGYQTTPSMCGLTVQVLDIRTCKTSNTVVL